MRVKLNVKRSVYTVPVAVSSSANADALMPTLRGQAQTRAAGIPAGGFFLVKLNGPAKGIVE
jgi:hypothetical protein